MHKFHLSKSIGFAVLSYGLLPFTKSMSTIGIISLDVNCVILCLSTISCSVSIFFTFFNFLWYDKKPKDRIHSGRECCCKSGDIGGDQSSVVSLFESM